MTQPRTSLFFFPAARTALPSAPPHCPSTKLVPIPSQWLRLAAVLPTCLSCVSAKWPPSPASSGLTHSPISQLVNTMAVPTSLNLPSALPGITSSSVVPLVGNFQAKSNFGGNSFSGSGALVTFIVFWWLYFSTKHLAHYFGHLTHVSFLLHSSPALCTKPLQQAPTPQPYLHSP